MHQIKFRIWDKVLKRWLCEDSQYLVMDGSEVLPAPWSTIQFKTNNEHYAIQQFTGLVDKNNREIYEGDIVEIPDKREDYIVILYNFAACFLFLPVSYELDTHTFFCVVDYRNYISDMIKAKSYKIIGNVFENEELMCVH